MTERWPCMGVPHGSQIDAEYARQAHTHPRDYSMVWVCASGHWHEGALR